MHAYICVQWPLLGCPHKKAKSFKIDFLSILHAHKPATMLYTKFRELKPFHACAMARIKCLGNGSKVAKLSGLQIKLTFARVQTLQLEETDPRYFSSSAGYLYLD